jgi:hypothetical protein
MNAPPVVPVPPVTAIEPPVVGAPPVAAGAPPVTPALPPVTPAPELPPCGNGSPSDDSLEHPVNAYTTARGIQALVLILVLFAVGSRRGAATGGEAGTDSREGELPWALDTNARADAATWFSARTVVHGRCPVITDFHGDVREGSEKRGS